MREQAGIVLPMALGGALVPGSRGMASPEWCACLHPETYMSRVHRPSMVRPATKLASLMLPFPEIRIRHGDARQAFEITRM